MSKAKKQKSLVERILDDIFGGLNKHSKKIIKAYKRMGIKKLLIKVFPYLMFAYAGNKLSYAYRMTPGAGFFEKFIGTLNTLAETLVWPPISINGIDMLVGIASAGAIRGILYYKMKNAKKFRKGEEYGSARWGERKDIEPYMDLDDPENNVIMTQTEGLRMLGRPSHPMYERNRNILVIGGSGSGKTRFFVKPNLMQLHTSYVVTDPKGTVLLETGKMFQKAGYEIKVLNTINFKKSMHYNPFAYLHSEKDILKLVNTLIVNTKGEGQQASEDFWVKAEKLLYQAYIGYIYYECIEEEQNFKTLIDMINASEAKEDDENFKNAVDLMFEDLEKDDPDHFAVKQYKKYKLAAGVINYKRFLIQSFESQPMVA